MSPKERTAFEQQLKHNAKLAEELAFAKKAYAHLQKQQQRNALKKTLKEVASGYKKESDNTKVFRLPMRKWLAAAASIALILGLFFRSLQQGRLSGCHPGSASLSARAPQRPGSSIVPRHQPDRNRARGRSPPMAETALAIG